MQWGTDTEPKARDAYCFRHDVDVAEIGFVDITDPALPTEIGTLPLDGSPTSVAVTPDGDFALVAVSGTNELVVVDLETQTVSTADGSFVRTFEINSFVRNCLLNGLDDIALTLQHDKAVAEAKGAKYM